MRPSRALVLTSLLLLTQCQRGTLLLTGDELGTGGDPASDSAGSAGRSATGGTGGAPQSSSGGFSGSAGGGPSVGGGLTIAGASAGGASAGGSGEDDASVGGAGTFGCHGGDMCGDALEGYPSYRLNHPECAVSAVACSSRRTACGPNCPEPLPADAETAPAPEEILGTAGGWTGCRGSGVLVCAELVAAFPLYLARHPLCTTNANCQNSWGECNAACPAPTARDRGPTEFKKCRGGALCPSAVTDHQSYFVHHFSCLGLDPKQCGEATEPCPAECPPPAFVDKKPLSDAAFSWFQPVLCAAADPTGLCLDHAPALPADYFVKRPGCHPIANCGSVENLDSCNLACLDPTCSIPELSPTSCAR